MPDDAEIVLVTSDAQVLRTAVDGIRVQGARAAGVAGMNVRAAPVVAGGIAAGDAVVATVTESAGPRSRP